MKKKGTESQPHSFFAEGEYDLNKDGKPDKINLMLKGFGGGEEVKTYIEVNGIRQDFYMELSPEGEVGIIDLDKNDKFLRLHILIKDQVNTRIMSFIDTTGKDYTQSVAWTAVDYVMARENCYHSFIFHGLNRLFILLGLK